MNKKPEILITKNSDRKQLKRIAKILAKKLGAKFVDEDDIDSDYINYIDTVYWDFEYCGVKFTLHLEHYSGIVIFINSKETTEKEIISLNEIEIKLKEYYRDEYERED